VTSEDATALFDLRCLWQGAYAISVTDGIWVAHRLDNPTCILTADTAQELRWPHPDQPDGGDPARYTVASAAYAMLRTRWGRSEAYADLAATAPPLTGRVVTPTAIPAAVPRLGP
jgi:hypothetical protein